ncbi:MAG: ABC transporter permease [Turicibacter sp.]
MNSINPTSGYATFLKNQKKESFKIRFIQIGLFVLVLVLWEWLANIGVIDSFLFSQPSAIWNLLVKYTVSGEIWKHLGISVWETILGLVIGTLIGLVTAIALWWSKRVARIFDPFLVVLNALPKTALAPILIVWAGAGIKGIVVIAIVTSVVVTILSAYNYFMSVDEEKIKLLESFGASKFQILTKLILPSNSINMVNIVKINIGMAWVGVIVGEFIVSRAGIGYLIVYGGQVFRLDIVMMGVMVLAICALIMYQLVNYVENKLRERQNVSNK